MKLEMKRFALAAVGLSMMFASGASAADLAVKAPPVAAPVAVPFSWTGIYIGGNVGGGWGTTDWTDPNNCILCSGIPRYLGKTDVSGWLAGGQIGANYQMGSIVIGIEADGAWANINGSHIDITTAAPGDPLNTQIDAIGSITGRLGYAFDRALFYVKGGGAWVNEKHSVQDGNRVQFATADSLTRWGWTIGAGLEYAIDYNWSIKGEYQYMDFGNESNTRFRCPVCILGDFNFNIDQKVNIAKIGLNYRFGGGPAVVAKY
jgi:outer membrane immunogenic protein